MIYNEITKGKLGIQSAVTKKMVFGICCDTKQECFKELRKRIGNDSLKYRFRCQVWDDNKIQNHINQKKEFNKERKEYLNKRNQDIKKMKEVKKFIKENINNLTEYQLEKYKNSGRYNINLHNYKDAEHLFKQIIMGNAYIEPITTGD